MGKLTEDVIDKIVVLPLGAWGEQTDEVRTMVREALRRGIRSRTCNRRSMCWLATAIAVLVEGAHSLVGGEDGIDIDDVMAPVCSACRRYIGKNGG
jgi:hypothetical protein